jgi:hypothetical protein
MCDCCCGSGMNEKESEKRVDEILEEARQTRKKARSE